MGLSGEWENARIYERSTLPHGYFELHGYPELHVRPTSDQNPGAYRHLSFAQINFDIASGCLASSYPPAIFLPALTENRQGKCGSKSTKDNIEHAYTRDCCP
jgi:hypothetical protein